MLVLWKQTVTLMCVLTILQASHFHLANAVPQSSVPQSVPQYGESHQRQFLPWTDESNSASKFHSSRSLRSPTDRSRTRSHDPRSVEENTDVARDQYVPAEYHASLNGPLANTVENQHLLRPEKCIPITIPLCKNIGYNFTYMPNAFHHETQEEAGLEVHQFYPLVEINCSEDLRLFLCSLYTPICLPNWSYKLTACRSLCESARDGCLPVMDSYGFRWPERMNCNLFPEGNECVTRRNSTGSSDTTTNKAGGTHQSNSKTSKHLEPRMKPMNRTVQLTQELLSVLRTYQADRKGGVTDGLHRSLVRALQQDSTNPPSTVCLPCRCRDPFVPAHKPPYNAVVTGDVIGCLPSCRQPYFSAQSNQTFTTFWLGLWAVLCVLSTLATVATFLADPGRFQYPERPIIYLSVCYLMVAIGYLLRVGMGHESIACDGATVRRGSTSPAQCSIVFLLTYMFGMASSVWWVVLTLTWFLAAGLKWGSEAIAKYSQCYHFLAWFFPGAQVIFVLILSAIDGDPISGLCYVGSTNLTHLRIFVLAPMCIYLGLGTMFLVAGFVALFKIRSAIKLQTRGHLKTDKLEKLMIRIGIFGVLYIVPAAVVIGCICYELLNRDSWDRGHNCPCVTIPTRNRPWREALLQQLSSKPQTETISLSSSQDLHFPLKDQPRPEHAVFMLKYFMSLVVGITSGFWIWSSKTLSSWQSCLRRTVSKTCLPHSKHASLHANNPVMMSLAGTLVTGRTPASAIVAATGVGSNISPSQNPPNCPLAWRTGQSTFWINGNNTTNNNNNNNHSDLQANQPTSIASNQAHTHPSTLGGGSSAVGSLTTWQDEFGPTSRLLPQPPTPSAATTATMNGLTCQHSLGMHLGSVSMQQPGSYTGGVGATLMDGTGVSGTQRMDNGALLNMNIQPITHI